MDSELDTKLQSILESALVRTIKTYNDPNYSSIGEAKAASIYFTEQTKAVFNQSRPLTEQQKKAFIDALQVELEGQELAFDEHEWLTLVICLKRALEVVS